MTAVTRLTYRPPVTVVRFSGDVTTITDSLAPRTASPVVQRTGTATVVVRADPRRAYTIEVPGVKVDTLKATLKLLEDGRLSGSSATLDDRSTDVLGAVIKTGFAAGAFALTLGAPPVAAALGTVAVGAAAAFGLRGFAGFEVNALTTEGGAPSVRDEYAPDQGGPAPATQPAPTATELGIDARFGDEMPADHERLYRYRLALLRVTLAHAVTASEAVDDPEKSRARLAQLDKVLASVRAEAARAESVYEVWRKSKLTTKTVHVDRQFFVDDLPSTERFQRELAEDLVDHEDAPWWDVATKLGVMVTCDLEDPSAATRFAPPPAGASFTDGTIVYRPPVPARLTTWRLEHDEDEVGRWNATLSDTQWIVVTDPRVATSIRIPFVSEGDAQVDVDFAASGALVSFSSDRSGRVGDRAQALAALPADLAASAKSGADLASTLSPAAARTARLKQQVDELEQRQKLNGLLHPAPDDLAPLRAQLAEAELQSRLAVATHMVQDPGAVSVTIEQTSAGGAAGE